MEVYRRSSWLIYLLGLFFLTITLTDVQGEVDGQGPTESECRPYIEKALKELEGDISELPDLNNRDSLEEFPTIEITTDDSSNSEDAENIQNIADNSQDDEDDKLGENDDDDQSNEQEEVVEETQQLDESGVTDEDDDTVINTNLSNENQEEIVDSAEETLGGANDDDDEEILDVREREILNSIEVYLTDEEEQQLFTSREREILSSTNEEILSRVTREISNSKEVDEELLTATNVQKEETAPSSEHQEAETETSKEESSENHPIEAQERAASEEQEQAVPLVDQEDSSASQEKTEDFLSAEKDASSEEKDTPSKEQDDSSIQKDASSKEKEDTGQSSETDDTPASSEDDASTSKEDTASASKEDDAASVEKDQAVESSEKEDAAPIVKTDNDSVSVEKDEVAQSAEQDDNVSNTASREKDDPVSVETGDDTESTENKDTSASTEKKDSAQSSEKDDSAAAAASTEKEDDTASTEKDDSPTEKESSEKDTGSSESSDASAEKEIAATSVEKEEAVPSKERQDQESAAKNQEGETMTKAISSEEVMSKDTATSSQESVEDTIHQSHEKSEEKSQEEIESAVEELVQELEEIPDLRPREHVNQILKLDEESTEAEEITGKLSDVILKDLKKLYENAIKPLEGLYKYRDLSNRHFGDSEIFSKPLILFMGPWSGGKSSIINYLLNIEYNETSLHTGAEPSPAYFNILMHGDEPEILDGTELAADYTFSGLQKFGQGLEERLRGYKLPSKLLEKVNIVEIPGILEVRKQVSRVFPFNDACQWFIDRADIIFLIYDPSKLDVGPETEAILDQLKGREYQTRIVLNKADQIKPEELMRVQGALIWNISPLMSSAQPPVMYTTSLWSKPYESWAPVRLLQAQERAFLKDLRLAVEKRIDNKIASARRFAVRVRNHAKMVDCYLTTYYNHKSVFGNRKHVSDEIINHPQDYHIYEGLSTLTNISRYDLPDPDVYRDFFKLNALYDFQPLSATCTYFRGCPINRLDVAIAYDLPELVGKHKRLIETALSKVNTTPVS